jgi:CheY-like chemotaxis protein/HPt (histidine-containing phosphotransfer) domain-containing protein
MTAQSLGSLRTLKSPVEDWTHVAFPTPGGPNDVRADAVDSDKDGIPNTAKVKGGTFAGLDLYRMGARPGQRDLFIHVDYMGPETGKDVDPGLVPQNESLQKVVDVFKRHNIRVHFDVGNLFTSSEDQAKFNLSGNVNHEKQFAKCTEMPDPDHPQNCRSLYEFSSSSPDVRRRPVFRYMLLASSQIEDGTVGTGPEPALRALRILLAEDSPDNCIITMAYLEDTPYRVEIAETGAIACKMFEAGYYDLVLMDRQMPVMDGLTATRTIRAWEQANDRPPTPIIALTASALKGDREMCLAAGCTAFLTKPIKQEVLLQAIREHSIVAPSSSKEESNRMDPIRLSAKSKSAIRIPAYLRNCKQNVIVMLDALDRVDFETVTSLGHQMMGSGGMFGFQAITDIGRSIELAAESADTDASRKWVGALSIYLDGVETISN